MRTSWIAASMLCLVGGAMGTAVPGCSPEQWQELYRDTHEPSDYDTMPKGLEQFNTRAKVAKIKDEELRNDMNMWFDKRQEYLRAWRKKGEVDPDVRRLKNFREAILIAIKDRIRVLMEEGNTSLTE